MRRAVLAVVAFAPLLCVAQGAAAQPPAPAASDSTYVFAKLGGVVPVDDYLTGFTTGPALEGGVGFPLASFFAVEVGAGYFSMDAGGASKLSAFPIVGSLRLSARARNVELFGVAGAGVYFISVESHGFAGPGTSDSDTAYAGHLGGGLSVFLSPHVSLGFEAKLLVGELNVFGDHGRFDSVLVSGMLGYRF